MNVLFSREVHLGMQSACSGCRPEVWEPRQRTAKKKCHLPRLIQGFATFSQTEKGWISFARFPPAVFSTSCHMVPVLLLGLTCHPHTAEVLETAASPQSSCSLLHHPGVHENMPWESIPFNLFGYKVTICPTTSIM